MPAGAGGLERRSGFWLSGSSHFHEGEDFDRALGGALDGAAWQGDTGEAGGNIDDVAAIVDQRQQFLRQEVDAFEANDNDKPFQSASHL